jgi:hypothetical protein
VHRGIIRARARTAIARTRLDRQTPLRSSTSQLVGLRARALENL